MYTSPFHVEVPGVNLYLQLHTLKGDIYSGSVVYVQVSVGCSA